MSFLQTLLSYPVFLPSILLLVVIVPFLIPSLTFTFSNICNPPPLPVLSFLSRIVIILLLSSYFCLSVLEFGLPHFMSLSFLSLTFLSMIFVTPISPPLSDAHPFLMSIFTLVSHLFLSCAVLLSGFPLSLFDAVLCPMVYPFYLSVTVSPPPPVPARSVWCTLSTLVQFWQSTLFPIPIRLPFL